MGDISKNAHGVRVQDVKITSIPPENARLAIRMVGARQKRVLSETRKAELAPAGNSTRFGAKRPSPGVESTGAA
jgi:hypothetical protein